MYRRRLLLNLLTLSLCTLPGRGRSRVQLSPGVLTSSQRATFSAYLDHLIPSDEHTPGAVALGLDQRLLTQAKTDKGLRRLLKPGCAWLDQQARAVARTDFSQLDTARAEQIIQRAAQAKTGSLAKLFFRETRRRVMHAYYAEPRIRDALSWGRPPQPAGHLDYQQAPDCTRD